MDFNSIMKQAQKMQEQMEKQEAELKEKEYNSTISSSIVKVTANGDYKITNIEINEDFAKDFEFEDKEILEDALCLAVTDVLNQINGDKQDALGDLAGSIKIPGLR